MKRPLDNDTANRLIRDLMDAITVAAHHSPYNDDASKYAYMVGALSSILKSVVTCQEDVGIRLVKETQWMREHIHD